MARSHICLSCGLDVGRIAPVIDPLYGLPLVHCPRCAGVSVRRVADVRATWRWWRRVIAGVTYAAFHAFLVGATSLIVIGALGGMTRGLESYGLDAGHLLRGIPAGEHRDPDTDLFAWYTDRGQLWLIAFLCLSVLSGAVMQAVLPHWKRRTFVPVWILCMHGLLLLPHAFDTVQGWLRAPPPGIVNPYTPPGVSTQWDWPLIRHTYVLLWITLVVSAAGVPIGRIVRRTGQRLRRNVLKFYKRRVRLARDQT